MRLLVIVLGWMLLAAGAQGQTLEVAGYAKSLTISSRQPEEGEAFLLNLNRIRAEAQGSIHRNVRLEAWLDSEILTGSFLRTELYEESRRDTTQRWIDLDWTVARSKSVEVRQRLFRVYATVEAGRTVWTVGRQRIAWGTGFAWNPTDLLNPFNPGAIELAERGGIDAVHTSIALGTLSRVEAVVAATDQSGGVQYAARAGTNWREYDVSLMGGVFDERKAIGVDFAGYIGGAGLRGEWAWVHPDAGVSYLRAVLNTDYTFQPGVYALAEVYYNGLESVAAGEAFGRGQWYAAFTLSAPVAVRMGLSAYGLVNMSDGSALCGPAITVSLAQELELQAAAYLFAGTKDSEFGRQQPAAFAALQWYY